MRLQHVNFIIAFLLLPAMIQANDLDQLLKRQRAIIVWPQNEMKRPQVNWYWTKIKEIAASDFKGVDLELGLRSNYKIGGDDEGTTVGASVPVHYEFPFSFNAQSKKERISQRKTAQSFLEEGAKLCAQLESALRTYLIYQEAYSNYEALAQDEGASILEKLIATQVKIVNVEALITQTHRQLQSLIAPYSKSVQIQSWDKGIQKVGYKP